MTKPKIHHPHAHTLQLLRLALEHLPPGFGTKRAAYFKKRLAEFKVDDAVPYEELRLVITKLGRDSWAERQAYQEMYARYGRASEEAFLLLYLDQGLRAKFGKFIDDGGKINHLENKMRSAEELTAPSPFVIYFTPEEKFAITQSLLAARDQAHKEIKALIKNDRRQEYRQLVREFHHQEKEIEEKIQQLAKLAPISSKWREAIADRVRLLEEGWSVLAKGATTEELDRELNYWQGKLAISFLRG